jgi:uncharacterized protein with HEPN domain
MRLESRKFLFDILQAAKNIGEFCGGKTFEDYSADSLLRAGTERQFEIIGEALRQLAMEDPAAAARIHEYKRIIAFRNILIHGYAEVDDRVVWDVLQNKLPSLLAGVRALLANAPCHCGSGKEHKDCHGANR